MHYARACVLALLLPALQMVYPFPSTTFYNATGKVSAAERNPDAEGNYHVGDGVSAPKISYAPEPATTKEARQKHISGTVSIWAIVDENGIPKDVHVDRSLAEDLKPEDKHLAGDLNEYAIKCVEQYRFEPARFKGKPVPVQIHINVNYKN